MMLQPEMHVSACKDILWHVYFPAASFWPQVHDSALSMGELVL